MKTTREADYLIIGVLLIVAGLLIAFGLFWS